MARVGAGLPNRLFIKLLLAFWLTSLVIVGAVILLPKFQQLDDRQPLQTWQQEMLTKSARRIERLPIQDVDRFVDRLRHPDRRPPPGMMQRPEFRDGPLKDDRFRFHIVTPQGGVLGRHQQRLPKPVRKFLLESENLQQQLSVRSRSAVVFGPQPLTLKGEPYLLLVEMRKSHPRSWLFYLQDNPLVLILAMALASGIIFGFVAWHFGKPLNALKRTAQQLAEGDLDARVDRHILGRRDEVGQLAKSFDAMASSLSTQVREQQRLISDISHELRTPLTRIQLALALARKKGQDSNELMRLGQQADQMEMMIQELLQLSRLTNQGSEHRQRFALDSLLDAVIDGARFEAEQQGKQVHTQLADGLTLVGNDTLLCRAVENLLRNAIRYGEHRITLTTEQRQQRVLISVEDDGPGVPPAQLEAIFKPFHRVSEARDRQSGGWGLGLAIVQAAATAHHGSVAASLGQQGGLKVTLNLPAA
ncbi:ATP-binding protein [Ferrimonas sp. SCSIO 43195]|uniref:ATP-binding protein n=1 Tax=Ferrimonas sp. SCSIO 43195 TaxID=2822844 RepID=UPI00207600AB|nr:ATP-binding protein [Ferrimonas sp. SCSIO 43195]USD37680.1 HAMP domain-containing protein [Ferrimonas sp. SCSIO 43195]